VLHFPLPLMNNFNKTEAAIFITLYDLFSEDLFDLFQKKIFNTSFVDCPVKRFHRLVLICLNTYILTLCT